MEEDISFSFHTFGQKRLYRRSILIDRPHQSPFPFQIAGLDKPVACPDTLFVLRDKSEFIAGASITAVRLHLATTVWAKGQKSTSKGWQPWQAIPGNFYLSEIGRMGWDMYPVLQFSHDMAELNELIQFIPLGNMTQTSEGQYQVSNPTEGTYQIDPETFLLTRIDEPADKMPRPPENDQDQ